jgi:diaminopimelate decarboxylase
MIKTKAKTAPVKTETAGKNKLLYSNLSVNEKGHLAVAGYDAVELAKEYGTPLYVLDENRVRENCRLYTRSMSEYFGAGSHPLYASKALSFKGIYKIAAEEGMSVDVVSPGELYTALAAGFPAERVYFHGNNKTDNDIRYAVDSGIGYFVVDNSEELKFLNSYAGSRGVKQKILVRLTPGIDNHTFAAVNTGKVDSQFGNPIETGQALKFIGEVLKAENTELMGFHCHIGSQIFDWIPFRDAAEIMLKFITAAKNAYGYEAKVLNLGGGFGVRYTEADPVVNIRDNIKRLAEYIKAGCGELGITYPLILMEPGRSIVADACVTLYTAGGVKTIEDHRSYVTVDGGMADNPRYALYRSKYTVLSANRMNEAMDFKCSVAGRCCESGDLIQEHIYLPEVKRGDIIAVLTTGAYNFAMASNYNRLGRPPILMLTDKGPKIAVRRETYEDMCARDV